MTTYQFAKARRYQRRLDAAIRRSRMARLTLSDKARELHAIRAARPTADDIASWFGWNGEWIRGELRSWMA